jgi:Icc protein
VILSGDIVNGPESYEYGRAAEILEPLPIPLHPLPGNHDDRDLLRSAFPSHQGVADCGEFIQYEAECAGLRLLVLDTLDAGNSDGGGRLDEARLGWLAERLGERPGEPVLIAMHHPPILTGMRGFDEIGLPEADRGHLREVLEGSETRLIVAGHVHRTMAGALGSTRVLTVPSVNLQSRLDLSGSTAIELVADPPGFAVHAFNEAIGIVSHIEPLR